MFNVKLVFQDGKEDEQKAQKPIVEHYYVEDYIYSYDENDNVVVKILFTKRVGLKDSIKQIIVNNEVYEVK